MIWIIGTALVSGVAGYLVRLYQNSLEADAAKAVAAVEAEAKTVVTAVETPVGKV